jgi:hypothetical protein
MPRVFRLKYQYEYLQKKTFHFGDLVSVKNVSVKGLQAVA